MELGLVEIIANRGSQACTNMMIAELQRRLGFAREIE